MDELDQRVRASAAPPQGDFDAAAVARRVRRRRRRRWLGSGLGATVLVALAALGVVAVLDGDGHQIALDDATRGPAGSQEVDGASPGEAAERVSEDDLEVLAVRHPPYPGFSKLLEGQLQLDELWTQRELEGSPPALSSHQDALIVSVRGDCEASHVGGMERIRAVNRPGDFAVLHVDPSCVNSELGRHGGDYDGPHTLYVVGVPSRLVEEVAGVQAVTTPVSDFEWQFLAAARDPRAASFPASPSDQSMLDFFWERSWELEGPAPDLPEGWSSILMPVPGTCTDESQLRGVEAVGYVLDQDTPTVVPAVSVDPACAEVLENPTRPSSKPRTVYAIIVPDDVGETLGRPRAYIACRDAEAVGECEDAGDVLINTDTGQRAQIPVGADRQAPAGERPSGSGDAPQKRTHVVERGDTLSGLAQTYYGNADAQHREAILQANDMESPASLEVGQELIIPPDPTG